VPEFDFAVVAITEFASRTKSLTEPSWVIEHNKAVAFVQDSQCHTKAVIGVGRDGFADSVNAQLVKVANTVVKTYGKLGTNS
jgi:hypothetical protein